MSKADGDSLINGSQILQLCADLANGSKHLVLTRSRTGDTSTTIARNDVTVRLGTGGSAHRFYVQSAGTEYDVLQVAEDGVDEWCKYLTAKGSFSPLVRSPGPGKTSQSFTRTGTAGRGRLLPLSCWVPAVSWGREALIGCLGSPANRLA